MNKKSDDYLKEPYARIILRNDDGTYSGEILEFPGCFAVGNSPDEVMQNLDNAALSWIEVCLSEGIHIPRPVANQGFGGKIALRLPKSLHRQAAKMAERDGVSLNQFLVDAIAERIGMEKLIDRLCDKIHQKIVSTPQIIEIIKTDFTTAIPEISERRYADTERTIKAEWAKNLEIPHG